MLFFECSRTISFFQNQNSSNIILNRRQKRMEQSQRSDRFLRSSFGSSLRRLGQTSLDLSCPGVSKT